MKITKRYLISNFKFWFKNGKKINLDLLNKYNFGKIYLNDRIYYIDKSIKKVVLV